MALDHALASCLDDGHAVLRLYAWTRPTVSFGRNEPARGHYSEARADHLGIDFVRRPTGGRAVLHDAELTYTVVAPIRGLAAGIREAYAAINAALSSALRTLGAPVEVAAGAETLALDAGPCFQSPADGEVTLRGRKLVGSAQARVDGALLQHGSIILFGDQGRIDHLRSDTLKDTPGVSAVDSEQPATLYEAVGAVPREMVAEHVVAAMKNDFGGTWSDGGYTDRERSVARTLLAERYGTREWTWRR